MGRLLLFLAIVALLWALFRAFMRYLGSASTAPARRSAAAPDDPERVAWYRRQGYRRWIRYQTGYTLYTRTSGPSPDAETLVEEHLDFSPWFVAESDEAQRWVAEQNDRPPDEGEPWSRRWIANRGIRGEEVAWLPPGQRPS